MARKRTRAKPIFVEKHALDGPHPALAAYLDSLGESSQRTQRTALEQVAHILTSGRVEAEELAWHQLDAAATAALRKRLLRLYKPSTG